MASKKTTLSLLAALAIGFGSPMATPSAYAGPCPNGPCPNSSSGTAKAAIASVERQVKSARDQLAGSNSDLQAAYATIVKVHSEAKEKRVDGISSVRDQIAMLAKDIETHAEQAYDAAYQRYFYGEHEEALEAFKSLAKLKGVPAAKKAASEVRKEDDRAEWRELHAQTTKLVNAHDFEAARAPMTGMERLARRTGYGEQNTAAMAEYETVCMKQVEGSQQAIEQEQFDTAYRTLLNVSRLSPLRKTAAEARDLLTQSTRELAGMQLAQREYEAAEKLEKVREDIAEEKRSKASIQKELETIATQYEGTDAAEQALRLAKTLS